MKKGTDGKQRTLMGKLIIYFLIIIILMVFLSTYLLNGFKVFYGNFNTMLKKLVDTYYITVTVDEVFEDINNYAHSGTESYIEEYNNKLRQLQKSIEELKAGSKGEVYYKFKNVANMVATFDEKTGQLVANYKVQMPQIYINQLVQELWRLKGYIQDEVKNLLLIELLGVQGYYSGFSTSIQREENVMVVLTAFVSLLCVIFAFKFTRDISTPIHQLVLKLKRFAGGDLEVTPSELKANDEISYLITSFNHMLIEIKGMIGEIRQKADVERKLKEQEIKTLEISNLLKQSELNFLQSQINPHFLFNTMNSIATLADIEEAVQTKKMLQSLSYILRNNLMMLNEDITLRKEVEIIKNYLYIQRMRFGERIQHILEIDEGALEYKVPCMTLQPFVENAIIHGLEPKEGKGVLKLGIYKREESILVVIKDDGVGIPEDKLKNILEQKNIDVEGQPGTGIGVSNVIRRLEIKYGKNVVEVHSRAGEGTEVRINLEWGQGQGN